MTSVLLTPVVRLLQRLLQGRWRSSIVSRLTPTALTAALYSATHTPQHTTTRHHPTSFKASHHARFLGGARQLAIADGADRSRRQHGLLTSAGASSSTLELGW